jgi:hypothetical protein
MFINILIFSVILVAIAMLIMGIKMFFHEKADFPAHSCSLEGGDLDVNGNCAKCGYSEPESCMEKDSNP